MNTEIKEETAELPNENLSILSRAAEISAYIKSTTIGPNSTFDNKENEDVTVNQTDSEEKKVKKSPYKSENSINQQVVEKFSRMDINDIKAFQQQIQDHNLDKKIELEVRKKLEVKRAEEMASYLKIKNSIELMRQEAEKRHQLKMQEFERQIQAELEKEKQNELVYQAQRKTLATNNKKIQEQKEKQLKEQVKRFEDVYCKQETAFTKIIQSCNPEMSSALDAFKKQLTDIKNYKDSQKGSLEGTKASCIKLDALCQNLQKEIKEFETVLQARKAQKEAEEKKNAQLAAEAQKKEVIVPKQIVAIPPRSHEQASQQGIQDSSSTESEAFRIYSQYRQLLVAKREQTKRLEDTPELQQLRFALKHAINNPINLLNENQRMTLVEGYQKLFNLLSNQRINTPKGCVAVTDHVEASDWCRLKIAEKIIDRCDKEPSIVFFAASLTIALWQKFPDFGDIFKAILFRECPLLIPFKPPKLKGQSNEDFMSSWGYRLTNGIPEYRHKYEARTTNFAALLAGLWISFPRKGEIEISPYDIRHAWKYLANVLNTTPDSEYIHIIGKVLEVSGFMLHQIYGRQFVKMMFMIRDAYIPTVHSTVDEETSGSFSRLKEIVNSFFTAKKFSEPKGRVAPGYW